jgi:hypothetical protein
MEQSEPPYELRSLVTRMEQREVGAAQKIVCKLVQAA